MLKLSLVVLMVVCGAISAPAAEEPVQIVNQENDIQPDGSFKWSFETADGVKQEQSGQPKQIESETAIVIQGSASWTDKEGTPHQLTYVADENGYQPQSPDIPQAPEIPAAIAKALEYNAAHPEQDEEKASAKTN
ncbi:larval cuticle protein 1-like [Anthonomus grandis grandis]|uniref:larval cuticle protein 1-like n=1 Tax=Anthonomus grandis grandis TaxID=2921223 RepID=UPI002165ABA4|nr:larval cuticle protein 1-like [Anthonomus grandis grandis]